MAGRGILGKDRRGIYEVLRSGHDSTSCGVFSRQSITTKSRKKKIDARAERLGSFILESSFFFLVEDSFFFIVSYDKYMHMFFFDFEKDIMHLNFKRLILENYLIILDMQYDRINFK